MNRDIVKYLADAPFDEFKTFFIGKTKIEIQKQISLLHHVRNDKEKVAYVVTVLDSLIEYECYGFNPRNHPLKMHDDPDIQLAILHKCKMDIFMLRALLCKSTDRAKFHQKVIIAMFERCRSDKVKNLYYSLSTGIPSTNMKYVLECIPGDYEQKLIYASARCRYDWDSKYCCSIIIHISDEFLRNNINIVKSVLEIISAGQSLNKQMIFVFTRLVAIFNNADGLMGILCGMSSRNMYNEADNSARLLSIVMSIQTLDFATFLQHKSITVGIDFIDVLLSNNVSLPNDYIISYIERMMCSFNDDRLYYIDTIINKYNLEFINIKNVIDLLNNAQSQAQHSWVMNHIVTYANTRISTKYIELMTRNIDNIKHKDADRLSNAMKRNMRFEHLNEVMSKFVQKNTDRNRKITT